MRPDQSDSSGKSFRLNIQRDLVFGPNSRRLTIEGLRKPFSIFAGPLRVFANPLRAFRAIEVGAGCKDEGI